MIVENTHGRLVVHPPLGEDRGKEYRVSNKILCTVFFAAKRGMNYISRSTAASSFEFKRPMAAGAAIAMIRPHYSLKESKRYALYLDQEATVSGNWTRWQQMLGEPVYLDHQKQVLYHRRALFIGVNTR